MKLMNSEMSSKLVFLSIFLLGAFLLYWNITNYQMKKGDLIFDLQNQLALSESAYSDSIFHSILSFVRDDSLDVDNFKAEILAISNTFNGDSSILRVSSNSLDSISLFVTDNLPQFETLDSENSSVSFNFRKSVGDHFSSNDSIAFLEEDHMISISEITRIFSANLKKNELPHEFTLINADSIHNRKGMLVSFSRNHFEQNHNSKKSVLVNNYSGYLLKKILPEILLSTLLFIIVLFSFINIMSAWRKQRELEMMKGQFISNMTHELKTPISTISVALEALGQYGGMDDKEKKKEYLQMSKHEVNRLNTLVDKVLQMSFLDSKELVLETERLDLGLVIETLLSTLSLHFSDQNVSVLFEKVDDEFVIQADRFHINNLLHNLIDNSIKYASVTPEIKIGLEQNKDYIELSLIDNGIGIDKKHHDKVFDRFYRISEDDIHNVKGYGIGLHYVKDIVIKHKGQISLDSKLGKGTKITITLPKYYD